MFGEADRRRAPRRARMIVEEELHLDQVDKMLQPTVDANLGEKVIPHFRG